MRRGSIKTVTVLVGRILSSYNGSVISAPEGCLLQGLPWRQFFIWRPRKSPRTRILAEFW